ncbi:MAG: di-trans,poly-cis-decaprenylcistransferase [Clostridiales Family XIII bacterium]|jgi:undecaprenyl diphosphate synthase|nr:di-trans,poly-cis-decaprenylcistransferase [Clostridiales Family XIII bacterium]
MAQKGGVQGKSASAGVVGMASASGRAAVPRHVAIVMDGNGRWAKRNGRPRLFGHNAGMNAMTEIVRHASDRGVGYLTVYAFSTENWKRSADEVSGIFGLLVKFVELKLRELVENNVIVSVIGDYSRIPPDAKAALERTIRDTSGNTGMRFIIALGYGGRADILNAAKKLVAEAVRECVSGSGGDIGSANGAGGAGSVKSGTGADECIGEYLDGIDEARFAAKLGTAGAPDPDLIIRTSGEKRLSNFLLWESAYSEFVFTDVLWPDFTPAEFDRCVEEYGKRSRRFGGR